MSQGGFSSFLGVTSGFSLLSSLFCRSCSLRSHFSSATSNFASAKRKRSQKQIARAHAGGGGRATRRLGAAVAVSDRTSHLPLRTSHQPNENLPRKKLRGLTQGGWPSHQTIGSHFLFLSALFSLLSQLLSRIALLTCHFQLRIRPLRTSHQAIDAAAHQANHPWPGGMREAVK